MALPPSPVIQAVLDTASIIQQASLDPVVQQRLEQGVLNIYHAATVQETEVTTLRQQLSDTQQQLSTTGQMLQQSLDLTATAQAARAVAMDDAAAARAEADAAHITADMAQQASATLMTVLMSLQGFTTLLLLLTMTLAAAHLGALLPLQLLAALPLAKWMELTKLFSWANPQQRRIISRHLCACSTAHAALEVMRTAAVSLLLEAAPCIAPKLVFDLYDITPAGVYLLLAAQHSVAQLPAALQQRWMRAAAQCSTLQDLCSLVGLTGMFTTGAAPLGFPTPLLLLHAPDAAAHSSTATAMASCNQHITSGSCALDTITSSSTSSSTNTAQLQAMLVGPQSVLLSAAATRLRLVMSCGSQPHLVPRDASTSFGNILRIIKPSSYGQHRRVLSSSSCSERVQHSSCVTLTCDSPGGEQQAQPHCTQAPAPAPKPGQGSTNSNTGMPASCELDSSSSQSCARQRIVAATRDDDSQPAVWQDLQTESDVVAVITAVTHGVKGRSGSTTSCWSSRSSSSNNNNPNSNKTIIFTAAPGSAAPGDIIPTPPAAAPAVAVPAAHSCHGMISMTHSKHKLSGSLHQLCESLKNRFGSSSSSSGSQGMCSRHSGDSTSSSTPASRVVSSQGHQPRHHLLSRFNSLRQHVRLAGSRTGDHVGTTTATAAAAGRLGVPPEPYSHSRFSTLRDSAMDSDLPASSNQHSPEMGSRLTGRSSSHAVGSSSSSSSSMLSSCLPFHRVRCVKPHQRSSPKGLLQEATRPEASSDSPAPGPSISPDRPGCTSLWCGPAVKQAEGVMLQGIATGGIQDSWDGIEQCRGHAHCLDTNGYTSHAAADSPRTPIGSVLQVTVPHRASCDSSDAAASSDVSVRMPAASVGPPSCSSATGRGLHHAALLYPQQHHNHQGRWKALRHAMTALINRWPQAFTRKVGGV